MRRLCTAVEGRRDNPDRLYRRLSALGGSRRSAATALNEYIMEGRKVKKYELERCIKELRKYRQYQNALEVGSISTSILALCSSIAISFKM